MGKFTLTFDTETEADAIKRHMVADEMANIIFQITHNLKKQCMRDFENDNKKFARRFEYADIEDIVDHVFDGINLIIDNYNIDITEL